MGNRLPLPKTPIIGIRRNSNRSSNNNNSDSNGNQEGLLQEGLLRRASSPVMEDLLGFTFSPKIYRVNKAISGLLGDVSCKTSNIKEA